MSAKPGDTVVLTEVPPGLVEGLPREDREAITQLVGKPVTLVEFDEDGMAELEFTDSSGHTHFIYVNQRFIQPAK